MPLRARDLTILSVFALRLIEYGVARGLDGHALLATSGATSKAELAVPGAHIAAEGLFALYAQVMRALDDPAVPFALARASKMEDLDVMGFAVITANNGHEAIQRAVRYSRLLTNSARWEALAPSLGGAAGAGTSGEVYGIIRFHRDLAPTLGVRAANEAALAEFVGGTRQLHPEVKLPMRVRFRHPAPPDTRPHREFFGCPVEFDAPYNEFELSSEIYHKRLTNNPALSEFFARHAEELLRTNDVDDTVQARVRHEIVEALPGGDLTLSRIAKRLALSERSLRRYLRAEQTSFSQLVADVRYDQARTLLRAPRVSLDQTAYLLGFSNASTFSRAFKKWSGRAPSEYREQLGGDASAAVSASAGEHN